METNVQIPVIKGPGVIEALKDPRMVNWMNNPGCHTTMRIVQMSNDPTNRMAIMEMRIGIKSQGRDYYRVFLVTCRMTKYLFRWFTVATTVYDVNGQATIEKLTRFQQWLRQRGLPTDTLVQNVEFDGLNASEDYYENPLRLTIKPQYGLDGFTLYNVRESHYFPMNTTNPTTGKVITKMVKPRRKDNGQIMTLSRKAYRRLEVR